MSKYINLPYPLDMFFFVFFFCFIGKACLLPSSERLYELLEILKELGQLQSSLHSRERV